MRSLRIYLIAVIFAVVCLGNFVAALHGYRESLDRAQKFFDRQLVDLAEQISVLAANNSSLPENIFADDSFFQVWHQEALIASSKNADQLLLDPETQGFRYLSHQGVRWRVYSRINPKENKETVVVGRRSDLYNSIIDALIIDAIGPIIWSLPVLCVLIWLVIGTGLKPLRSLADLLRGRQAADLEAIDPQDYPLELKTIIAALNDFMTRLASAYDREKRFASDAAHELRTPLAGMKAALYNLKEDQEIPEAVFESLRTSIDRLSHSVEQILVLYRLTPESFRERAQGFDLAVTAREVIASLYDRAAEKDQDVSLNADSTLLQADEFAAQTLMKNLLDNAIKYTPHGGVIRISIGRQQSRVFIRVEDSGAGIPAEDRERVFDRFYRVGGDRHASLQDGCGLGLAIVRHIVDLHQGEVHLGESSELGGLLIEITLPAGTFSEEEEVP